VNSFQTDSSSQNVAGCHL